VTNRSKAKPHPASSCRKTLSARSTARLSECCTVFDGMKTAECKNDCINVVMNLEFDKERRNVGRTSGVLKYITKTSTKDVEKTV
jgi:hypothetical protein